MNASRQTHGDSSTVDARNSSTTGISGSGTAGTRVDAVALGSIAAARREGRVIRRPDAVAAVGP
ncbi:MAG: hypothetical protein ACRCY8_02295 [Dermatophilaceae bacterium]